MHNAPVVKALGGRYHTAYRASKGAVCPVTLMILRLSCFHALLLHSVHADTCALSWLAAALAVVTKSFSLAATGTPHSPLAIGAVAITLGLIVLCRNCVCRRDFHRAVAGLGAHGHGRRQGRSVCRAERGASSAWRCFLLLVLRRSAAFSRLLSRFCAACVLYSSLYVRVAHRALLLERLLSEVHLCLRAGPLLVLVRRLACWALWTK
jgi:hypothetical protein